MLDQLPRHQRAQRYPEQHQHGLGQERRHGERPSGQCGDADRDHRAGDQPARQVCPQKQQAARGADGERLERVEELGAAREGPMRSMRGSGSRRLMANPRRRDKCADAIAAMRDRVARNLPFPWRGTGELRYFAGLSRAITWPCGGSFAAFLHSDGISCVPCRAVPWRRLPSSIRARRRTRLLRLLFRRRLGVGLGRFGLGRAPRSARRRRPSAAAKRRRSRWQGKKS